MSYTYCIGDDKISEEFNSIEEALHSAVDNIYEDGAFVYNDKYILVEVMETEDYNDDFKSKFITLLEDVNETAHYDGIEDYLDGIDIYDLANHITEIWDKYKKSKGVRNYYKAKNGTQAIYKVYVKKDRDDYYLVNYDVYKK